MGQRDAPCGSCGRTDWRDATEGEYASMTTAMQRIEAAARRPDLLLICRVCGWQRVVLTQTFGAGTPDDPR